MQIWKKFTGICLAVAMAITGLPAEGLVLRTEAAPNTEGNAYLGVMLTEEEFNRISYTNADVDWSNYVPEENENGLLNYEARYMTEGATVNSVLNNLKERDKFYRQADEYGEDEEQPIISGDDGKTDEGYYAVFAVAQGTAAQEVTVPEGVKGILFDTHHYNELPEGTEPDENTEWFPYAYHDLTVEAKAPLTFRGYFANITVTSGTYSKDNNGNEYPIVLKGEAAGSIRGVAENGVKNSLYISDARLYGISGFSRTLFLPQTWRNDENGEEGIGRWVDFNSPTGEEKISFESICNAELDENGMPREIAEEEEATAVSLNMRYHSGYIPEISGKSNLGIWKGKNEETGEYESGFNNIDVNYYDVIEDTLDTTDHIFESGEQVVVYKSAAGWSSHVWYNSPEVNGVYVEYRIDAQGRLYRESDRRFRVSRYQNQAEYDAYRENGQWGTEDIGEASTIAGALQTLAYDSELNPNAYYTLGLIQDWDKPQDDLFWETELGNLSVPESVKGLRLTAEGQDTENGFRRITGTLRAVTVNAGTNLELTGWYKGTDGNIRVSGGGRLGLSDARINGNVLADNMAVVSRGNTAVKSLTGMKSLALCDDLTVENELSFAENGQLNMKEERSDARILARNSAKIEIPKADFVWDAEGSYSNRLSIFEEVREGKRPQIIFSGTPRTRGEIWPSFPLNYQKDAEEADENGWKPEYLMKCPSYIYVPKDGEGNPNWDEAVYDLIQLNDKVYQIEWDYENGEGTAQIELDNEACTLTNLKLKETEYNVSEIEENLTGSDDIELIPYEASKVEEAVQDNPELSLSMDPYADDRYGIDVFDEWNCEYQAEDEIAEYYVSGITDITDIVVLYGKWAGEGSDRHYEGTSCMIYPIQQLLHYVPEEYLEFTADDEYTTTEDGEKRYAMYYDFREEERWVKNSHYVSDTLPEMEPVQQPISLADTEKIEITPPAAATFTGSAILGKPVVKRKSDSYVLAENTDYTLGYQNNTNAGTASVTITAKEDSGYTGAQTVTFTINPKAVSGLTVSNVPNQTYTGSEIKPAITVSDGSNRLTTDDYSVSYSQNTNAGTAKITITGKRNYTGTLTKNFTISPKSVSGLTVSNVPNQTYTGSEIKPAITVSDGSNRLTTDDYSVSYSQNTNAGTAKITITGKRNYTGTLTKNFTISPKSVSGLKVNGILSTYNYTGKAVTPTVSVYDGNKMLVLNKDYSVSCSKNTNIGKAQITVSGKGNYTGTLTKNFTITVKKSAVYTVGGYKYKITNASTNGKGTVSVTGAQKKTIKKIKITDTVTIGGVKFKVTSIEKNAFKGCKKATEASIGKNVTAVGDNAFSGCTSLKKVTIGKSVKTIGKSAFEKDGKLKSIKISSTVLKKVGKNALKGIHKKAVISVPKKQLKSYKKLLKKKGQASSVKIK